MNVINIECNKLRTWLQNLFLSSKTKIKKDHEQYLNELKYVLQADFLGLEKTARQEILANFSQEHIEELIKQISLPELWTLELWVLKKLNENELLRRTWIIREKFRFQLGDDIYKRYTENLPETIKDESLKKSSELNPEDYSLLREDVINIARQMQRLGYYRIKRNECINERKSFVILVTMILTICGVIVFSLLRNDIFDFISQMDLQSKAGAKFFLLIVYSGIAGTAISLLQRIEKASNIAPHITDSVHEATDIMLNMSNAYIISLVVSGAFFALIVHIISIAQVINILDFLPKPESVKSDYNCIFIQLITPPTEPKEFAKLLIACFLSGFAERLIPDTLDSLIKKTEYTLPK